MLHAKLPRMLQHAACMARLGRPYSFYSPATAGGLRGALCSPAPVRIQLSHGVRSACSQPSPPAVELRPYQEELISSVLACKEQGLRRLLVQLPTGGGKTITFCELARRLSVRTLILVNREELVGQTVDALQRVGFRGREVRVLRGKGREADGLVVVSTIQTACQDGRLRELKKIDASTPFQLLIVDEAHHSTASTYVEVLDTLEFLGGSDDDDDDEEEEEQQQEGTALGEGVGSSNGRGDGGSCSDTASGGEGGAGGGVGDSDGDSADAGGSGSDGGGPRPWKLLLGVTATPYRQSGGDLNQVFEHLAYEKRVGELIQDGWLCKVAAERIMTAVDISDVDSDVREDGEGDFAARALSKVINTPERNALVVRSYRARAAGRRAVAFCCSVEHAEDLAAAFRSAGVSAVAVHSGLSAAERRAHMEAHKAGELQVVTNMGILTEGYDDPAISAVLMARPTKSAGLYTQCVGRGLRRHAGKEDCLILDFTDRHHVLDRASDLVTAVDVFTEESELVTLRNFRNPTNGIVKELRDILENSSLQLFGESGLRLPWLYHASSASYVLQRWSKTDGTRLIRLRMAPRAAEDKEGGGGKGTGKEAAASKDGKGAMKGGKGSKSGKGAAASKVEWQLEAATDYRGPWSPVYLPRGPPPDCLPLAMEPIPGKREGGLRALAAAEVKLRKLARKQPGNTWKLTPLVYERMQLPELPPDALTDPAARAAALAEVAAATDHKRLQPATDKQLGLLSHMGAWGEGGQAPPGLTWGQASDIITLMRLEEAHAGGGRLADRPASPKQVALINRLVKGWGGTPEVRALLAGTPWAADAGCPTVAADPDPSPSSSPSSPGLTLSQASRLIDGLLKVTGLAGQAGRKWGRGPAAAASGPAPAAAAADAAVGAGAGSAAAAEAAAPPSSSDDGGGSTTGPAAPGSM